MKKRSASLKGPKKPQRPFFMEQTPIIILHLIKVKELATQMGGQRLFIITCDI